MNTRPTYGIKTDDARLFLINGNHPSGCKVWALNHQDALEVWYYYSEDTEKFHSVIEIASDAPSPQDTEHD